MQNENVYLNFVELLKVLMTASSSISLEIQQKLTLKGAFNV